MTTKVDLLNFIDQALDNNKNRPFSMAISRDFQDGSKLGAEVALEGIKKFILEMEK